MAKSDELVKFITQRVVTYMDTPKELRRKAKETGRDHKENWEVRWFGMLPLAIRMLAQQVRRNAKTPPKG
jgi:hypothetical protein